MNKNGWRGAADPEVLKLLSGIQAIGAMTDEQLRALEYQEKMIEKNFILMSRVNG